MDTLGVQSSSAITPAIGIPVPKSTLSDDTLQLLEQVSSSLDQHRDNNNQPTKRTRNESPEGDRRGSYPKESKALYLKTESLHRKKLTLATNIHQIKKNLQNQKFPAQVNFNCNTPVNRSNVFKGKWATIAKDAKTKLIHLILDDLNLKYQDVKLEIQSNLSELQKILTNTQFNKINTFLNDRYKPAVNTALNKTSGGHSGRVVTLSPPTSEAGFGSWLYLKWESW